MKILVTGAAGFIGFNLSDRLLKKGHEVYGIDNLNDYYDVNLKKTRLSIIGKQAGFKFILGDLADREKIKNLFEMYSFDYVINLAAQAGVRHSIENPASYIDSNLVGFGNILEGCRHSGVKHLVYASSSSVYGLNTHMPFSVRHNVDHPISLYAASKKANELMAHTYSYLYKLPTTGLRFFTVYGPWGRPDMALFLFTKAILNNEPIKVFNNGDMQRDFTYIDDIVEGVVRVMNNIPEADPDWTSDTPNPSTSCVPYKLYNIGNNQPVALMAFIEAIENAIGKKAVKEYLPLQPGDVPATYADVNDLIKDTGFKPSTSIVDGINNFVKWYKKYYK
ncbi:MAG: NAD-dependent epimerase [Desulfobacula sp.]|jgi:UDP-glucuronate 4-epimerase|uniref:NAD-dependent epimerase n=1 Tax=Desulfobacula sp. TaxID=2593537 RepID=UPI001DA9B7C1|nr:NAD-dependent epimerase [Desulfobacula sp.]MBT3485444.1 NAD-dependent epimerase [Desulfobacula sp.]MBT3805587.1 NAD-dependent epimerase [Desulfobacula sp.]MBT4026083.1 NAD-dependent epimerase [Desulfobacula sp.]MBT4199969.1 NAD-dependent epimerase [Desulfobacula sp.]